MKKPAVYRDNAWRLFFVKESAIKRGLVTYCTFVCRGKTVDEVKDFYMPPVFSIEQAQKNLDEWAKKMVYTLVVDVKTPW